MRKLLTTIGLPAAVFLIAAPAHAQYGYGMSSDFDQSALVRTQTTFDDDDVGSSFDADADSTADARIMYDDSGFYSSTEQDTSLSADSDFDASRNDFGDLDDDDRFATAEHADAHSFVKLFLRPGAPASTWYDNSRLDRAEFDVSQYMSHECFHIASPAEEERCREEFGAFADFHAMLQDGTLFSMLQNHAEVMDSQTLISLFLHTMLDAGVDSMGHDGDDMLDASADDADETDEEDTVGSMTRAEFDQRSRAIWRACAARTGDEAGRRSCYESGSRLLKTASLPIDTGNVATLNGSSTTEL